MASNVSLYVTQNSNYNSFTNIDLSLNSPSSNIAILNNGTYYLVGGNAVITSANGVNWNNSAVAISGMSAINNFAWNNPNQGSPVIKPLTIACGEGNNTLAYSQDGIFWKGLGKTIFTTRANKAAWNGVLWVAVGTGNYWVASSYDGITWTGRENTLLTEGYDVAWNGTVFVAVGYGPNLNLAASRDGITWYGLPYSQVFSNYASSISWTGRTWLAYGSGGNTTAYSTDADAWFWNATPQSNLAITDASSVSTLLTYTLSSSSNMTNFDASFAFDNSMNPTTSTQWQSAGGRYTTTTGVYNGTINTTYNTTLTASGEWIQMSLESPIIIKYYYMGWFYDVSNSLSAIPKSWILLGSNNGTTWTSIDSFNYNLSRAPYDTSNNQFPFLIELQNVWSNQTPYQHYRFVFTSTFGGGTLGYVRVSEIDFFQANANSLSLNRFIKPIVTPTHILHPTTIIPFSQQTGKQTVYLITDLCCNMITNNSVNGNTYPTGIIFGARDKIITSSCFDGQTLVATPINGNVCYMNTRSLNTSFRFDNSFNGTLINSQITGNIYTSCYNGQRIVFGGTGGNVISYNTISGTGSTNSNWVGSLNANSLFTSVYGLASNPGYGFQYIPNRIYFNPGEKISIVAPKSYNKNLSPNNTISMNLNNISFIQNVVLPTNTVINTYFGATGPTGPTGEFPMGPNGAMGFDSDMFGPTGITGITGPMGVDGDIGLLGITGNDGETGATGDFGPSGSTGTQGPIGMEGTLGVIGIIGDNGVSGSDGIVGYVGPTGDYNECHWNINIIDDSIYYDSIVLGKTNGIDTLDISGTMNITNILYANQIKTQTTDTTVIGVSSISIDYSLGETYIIDMSNITQNFSCIISNMNLQGNQIYEIILMLDYANSGANRYYCNQITINSNTYAPLLESGTIIIGNTVSKLIQKFTMIVSNSTIWNIVGEHSSYTS